MTNKKPTTFTREEVVNHIKADILNAVLNEIVADDEGHISDSRGGILLSEAKEKVSKMVTEAVEEVKRITDIGELMVYTVSIVV